MDLSALFAFLVNNLGFGAAGGIIIFAATVILDDLAGVALAEKLGKFDRAKLGSFLESEVGTRRALVVAGSVAAGVLAALASAQLAHTSLAQALQLMEDAALALAIVGSGANFASVAGDLKDKLMALAKAFGLFS